MTREPERRDSVVRPFVVTGGRTIPTVDGLRVETMVVASVEPDALRFEQAAIVRHCGEPRSVAEIAAELHVPIGVAKVLVADLVAARALVATERQHLHLAALERITDLVRAL